MAFPANPYFWPESTKHDVTLTSLAAILSYSQCVPFDTMRKIDVQEGTESFATIDALVYEILRKNLRGAKNSPPTHQGAVKRESMSSRGGGLGGQEGQMPLLIKSWRGKTIVLPFHLSNRMYVISHVFSTNRYLFMYDY